MITGYNTDVRHGDTNFHVQTEDKGAGNPFIESLVYVGGQVLATKRASYAELLAEGKDDKAIIVLMDHQHRTMIAAIKYGKFDDKLASLAAVRQTGKQPLAAVAGAPAPSSRVTPPSSLAAGVGTAFDPPAAVALAPMAPMAPLAPISPAVVAAAVPETRGAERSLDQVILEYLTNEADQEQLLLLVDGDQDLALGQRADLALRTSSSKSGQPVAGAQVSVKMISTTAEPCTLAVGRTDDEGAIHLLFEIPQLSRGTAALIITAASAIGRAELKHLL